MHRGRFEPTMQLFEMYKTLQALNSKSLSFITQYAKFSFSEVSHIMHIAETFLRRLEPQFFKKFPAFCRTRRFITAFPNARQLSLILK